MQLDVRKLFLDMQEAAGLIAQFTRDKSLQDYMGDVMIRSAVERQFEIVGEALTQIRKIDPS